MKTRTPQAESHAKESYSKMSPAMQTFVRALYAVRNDSIELAHVFDTQRPTKITLAESPVLADTVLDLPDQHIFQE